MTFGVNMVAIADGKPVQMGIKRMIAYYIEHQSVISPLIRINPSKVMCIGEVFIYPELDEVIRTLRGSKNPKEAREKLVARFELTEIQAQAILDMRLQRLTNLEVLALRREFEEITRLIGQLKGILASEKKLMNVIKKELLEIRAQYADARRTQLVEAFDEIVIEEERPSADETVVLLTQAGFIKRMAPKAYERALTGSEFTDLPRQAIQAMTDTKLLFFTNIGNCYIVNAGQIPETSRAKERGLPLGGLLAGLEKDEKLVALLEAGDWTGELMFVTQSGLIKRTASADYNVRKSRFAALNLKNGDQLLSVLRPAGHESVLLLTRGGMSISILRWMKSLSLAARRQA